MEELGTKKCAMDLPPPAYLPKMNVSRKTWAWTSVVLLLLAVIVVGAVLIGVYMTQKHTEAVVEMAYQSMSGEKIQQTVMVNDKENVAAFYVNSVNTSTTILYDYNQGIVGFRRLGEEECYVMKMKDINAPTMKDVLNSIKASQQNTGTKEISYDFLPGEEKADRTKLGVPINILCSDQPIYWGVRDQPQQQRRWFKKAWKKIKHALKPVVIGIGVNIPFG